jgi:hypothetical protein
VKKILSFYDYLIIYCCILLLINILLLGAPLAKVFGYEFSAINSALLIFLAGLYYISLLKKLKNNVELKREFRKQGLTASALFIVIPAAVSLIHTLLTSSCSIKDGALFYTVLTLPSVLIGFSIALLCVYVFNNFHKVFFIIIFILILLIPVAEFYLNPQIYFYNPIFGFYPGTIYDEGLSVNLHLVLYRILNVVYFGSIAFALYRCILGLIRLSRILVLTSVILIAALFIYLSPLWGFSTTFNRLNSALNGTAVTAHFIIHYPPQLDKDFIKAAVIYHEYYYLKLKEFFGYDYPRKINSYLFYSDGQKKELFGTANADFAKPWMNSAFITYTEYNTALKHELAHCFASVIGSGPLKISAGLNPYLTEGMAVAADPVIDGNNVNYLASLAYNNNYKANLDGLFDKFSFFTQSSLLSYIYAGSFSKYLIKEYGTPKFEKLYHYGDFTGIYGQPLNKVVKDYYLSLTDTVLLSRKDEAYYYFGRKSIFYKVCPRYTQDRISEGWYYFNQKDYWKSKEMFGGILKITNDYSAVTGYAECLQKIDSAESAVKFLYGQLGQFKNSAYYYSLEMKLADMLSLNHNIYQADSIYKSLISQNPGQVYFYLANLRHNLLIKDSLITAYLKGNDFDKYNILRQYISGQYDYSAIPVLIDLAQLYDENYNLFMEVFAKNFDVDDFSGSYAMYKLSNYMLVHLDFERARKIAALAMRIKTSKNFDEILRSNYEKINWFYLNNKSVLNNVTTAYSN